MLGLSAVVGSSAHANPLDLPGWDLIWQDEFDAASPDTTEWELFNLKDSFNDEKQYYRPEQITTSGGNLVITATDQPLAGKQYRSGRMESWQEFGFGRFEASIKLPSGQGFWPAFWLLPETTVTPWPTGGEIDILENRGSEPGKVSSAYHYNDVPNTSMFMYDEYTSADAGGPVNFHNSFHTFAVEWEADEMRFFVDGNNYHTLTSDQVPIYATPKKIVLNLAVGGFFGGDPNGSTPFPSEMEVEYVRVWERPDGYTPPGPDSVLDNPGFDDNGGSLTDWNIFGNSIGNVSANGDLSESGGNALKLYGQFNGSENFSGVSQGVAVTEGASVQLQGSARTPSWDTLAGKTNEVIAKIEFYSVFGAAFGSGSFLGEVSELLINGSSPEDVWLSHTLDAVAPAGAVEARVVYQFRQPFNDNGAAWIDSLSLSVLAAFIPGDYNGDGSVGQSDLDLVLLNWGVDASGGAPAGWVHDAPTGSIGQTQLDGVLLNWGNSSEAAGSSVPEPHAACLVALVLGWRGRRRS